MQARRPHKGASNLWQAIAKSFILTRTGLKQEEPTHPKEIMRQPLFGNTLITQPNGEMLGLEGESTFFTWAKNGVFTIKDIWHYVKEDWMTEA